MENFVHLHVHTSYSLLDGLCRQEELIKKAKELGQPAIAITDHGNMFGAAEFYKLAKKEGIKPVIGSEMYVAEGSAKEKTPHNHLILLAKNNEGYKNLCKLSTWSYTEGFYYKPRIDYEILKKHSEGLICLTACLFGGFSKALVADDIAAAEKTLKDLTDIFGRENLYVELQNHYLPEQRKIFPAQIKLALKYGLETVVTNDVHYVNKEDSFYQEILMCIQMQKNITDSDRMSFDSSELYLKSAEELKEVLPNLEKAFENTVKIAERCNVELDFQNYHLPKFDLPQNTDSKTYLKELCIEGLKERYQDWESHIKRLEYELETINRMGFTDYFLIVWDFISYARKKDIPVGPGRGSAAGSLVSYVLKITDLDPIKYNLIFERFLNSERVTMPDIDIDFCYERRGEVIDYVIKKYGKDRVSQIITFGTLGARQVVRDVARALALPYNTGDEIAALIPRAFNITIKDALNESERLKTLYENDESVARIIDISLKLEGLPRHCSTHAAGVVITSEPLTEYLPLYKSDGVVSTQYTKNTVEELGLLKMDFLGLRNLTVINDTVKEICEREKEYIDISHIPLDDKEVYKLFSNGDTDGVFQFESAGMRRFLKEFNPSSLEDLILAVSIYRPGPMQEIPRLLKNKLNPEGIDYDCEELKSILSVTYGCMVYQEQVMQIFEKLAGYSMGKADIVRRAMSKKKLDVLEKEEIAFIEGCIKRNISEKAARIIFAKIKEFAKYAFNKSHAACYALVAYQTAFLKCHYTPYFMCSLMAAFTESQNKIIQYIRACNSYRIPVLPPDINRSFTDFSVSDKKIIFGLSAVKNVGATFADNIVKERNIKGSFKDFTDFAQRMSQYDLNKRAVECLIKAGAFDEFEERSELLLTFEETIDSALFEKRSNVPGQISMFGEVSVLKSPRKEYVEEAPKKPRNPLTELFLKMEKEVLGLYISAHPLDRFKGAVRSLATAYSTDLISADFDSSFKDGDRIVLIGVVTEKTVKSTKNKSLMAFFTLEDLYGQVRIIAFPKVYEKYSAFIFEDSIVTVRGKVSEKEDEITIIAEDILPFSETEVTEKLYLRVSDRRKLVEIVKILKAHRGNTPVYVYFTDKKENTLSDKDLWVNISESLIRELNELLSEENVKVVG